ncbi:hypothetical protein [Microbacterium terrisoli]|uniref:hypothetical protein n=1 Tax=Microbacterium terrisoli TaxID=3242192 RepID=UPI0028050AA1|nr:hypothetical protein [Microbacterium protaetiae]
MTTLATPGPRPTVTRLRRIIVGVIIVAFSLAALGGIVVLLGGDLGQAAWRVIGTTAIVGAFSVAVLCCAALLGRPLQPVGMVGVAVSVLAAALVIWTVWYDGDGGTAWEIVAKVTGTCVTASIALALGSLLLLLADRRRAPVRIGLIITLALFAVVVLLIVYLIWGSETVDDQVYPRALGIGGILAALGAVVVPVMSLLLPDARSGAVAPSAGALSPVALSPGAVTRLEQEARRRGIPPDALVETLLAQHTDLPPLEER